MGKGLLCVGLALIAATALGAAMDQLQTRPTDPWVIVFAAGLHSGERRSGAHGTRAVGAHRRVDGSARALTAAFRGPASDHQLLAHALEWLAPGPSSAFARGARGGTPHASGPRARERHAPPSLF